VGGGGGREEERAGLWALEFHWSSFISFKLKKVFLT
jgi:hypothetical protein